MRSAKLRGKEVTRQQVIDALSQFDSQYPHTNNYDSWLEKGNYKYAVRYCGKLYPCKYLLSLASDVPMGSFNGGDQTNRVFRTLGFEVINKPGKPGRAVIRMTCSLKRIWSQLTCYPLNIVGFAGLAFLSFLIIRLVEAWQITQDANQAFSCHITQDGTDVFSCWWFGALLAGYLATVYIAKCRRDKSFGATGPGAVLWALAIVLLSIYGFEIHPLGYLWLIVGGFTVWILLFSKEFTHVERVVAKAECSLDESSGDRIPTLALLSDQCKFYHDRVLAGILGVVTFYGMCLTIVWSTADTRPAWASARMSLDMLIPTVFVAAALGRYLALPMINLLYRIRCKAVGLAPDEFTPKTREVPVPKETKQTP